MDLTGSGPVLVDTSVWVSFLRAGKTAAPELAGALDDDGVVVAGPVIAELLQGLGESQRVRLERTLAALPIATLDRRDWVIAGHVAAELRRRGPPCGLLDVAIATAARAHELPVLTSDRAFLAIGEAFGDLEVRFVGSR